MVCPFSANKMANNIHVDLQYEGSLKQATFQLARREAFEEAGGQERRWKPVPGPSSQ